MPSQLLRRAYGHSKLSIAAKMPYDLKRAVVAGIERPIAKPSGSAGVQGDRILRRLTLADLADDGVCGNEMPEVLTVQPE